MATYNFNFDNKEDAIKQFRDVPLETLKEYRSVLSKITIALDDVIETKEQNLFNEMSAEILDLLCKMKKINPYATFCLQDEDKEEDIWLNLDNLINLF